MPTGHRSFGKEMKRNNVMFHKTMQVPHTRLPFPQRKGERGVSTPASRFRLESTRFKTKSRHTLFRGRLVRLVPAQAQTSKPSSTPAFGNATSHSSCRSSTPAKRTSEPADALEADSQAKTPPKISTPAYVKRGQGLPRTQITTRPKLLCTAELMSARAVLACPMALTTR